MITPQKFLERGLFLILGFLLGIFIFLSLNPFPVEGTAGIPHPNFKSMLAGGAPNRHQDLLWVGWLYGSLVLGFCLLLISFAVRARHRNLNRQLLIFGLIYETIWSSIVLAYHLDMTKEVVTFFLGFPLPTTIVLFAFWPLPICFIGMYIFGFDTWVYPKRNKAEFSKLMKTRSQHRI